MFLEPGGFNPFGSVEWDLLLHGGCDSFALLLAKKYPRLRVWALMETNYTGIGPDRLVHMFCLDEQGRYVDVRGRTADAELFWDEFCDWCYVDYDGGLRPEDGCYLQEVGSWKPTMKKNGYCLSQRNKLAEAILAHPVAEYLYGGRDFSEYLGSDTGLGRVIWAEDGCTILGVEKI